MDNMFANIKMAQAMGTVRFLSNFYRYLML